MSKTFEIVFLKDNQVFTAELLEEAAPITCEQFWKGIEEPWEQPIHHGGETGPELWCFVKEPSEELPYENSTVFPLGGDILYYHYRQPPTRDGKMVFDIGIYYDKGCSKLKQGWIPGNLFARIVGDPKAWRPVAGRLLMGEKETVRLRRA
ncbi:MAG: DUF3830 family protein [Kiritimatiellae bacterium]|nr:DUF3830 family protein [Kiritimatiellia bacterium]